MNGALAGGFVVAFGLAIGSFLNVCIYRLPRGESVVSPSSRCTSCGRGLRWFENVPVFGWLLIWGRCRTCRTPVSVMYPVVESVTALAFFLQYWQLGWQPLLAVRLLFSALMIVLFVIDLQHRVLPNVITLPGVIAGLVASAFFAPGWMASLVGVLVGGGLLWVVGEAYFLVRGEEGMGMGDVKMLAMIGAFLGWKFMLVTLLIASLTGSVFGGAMMLFNRGGLKYALPLGSFLAAGALVVTHAGQPLLDWYLSFY
jgi:leader peptidase (prepilin peptidase)/N-methyltransferase